MKKKPTTIQEEMQRQAEEFFSGLDQETKVLGTGVITNQSGPVSGTEEKWIYEAHIKMNERLKKQLMDDMLTGGECAYKTEIKDGKVEQTYVDPLSPEFMEKMANATGNYYPTKEMIERERELFNPLNAK